MLWLDVVPLHEGNDLAWDFTKHLLIEVTLPYSIIEAHELDDITWAQLAKRVAQAAIITIKFLHRREICTAHADNNN